MSVAPADAGRLPRRPALHHPGVGGSPPLLRTAAFWVLLAFVFSIPWEGVVTVEGVGRLPRLMGLLTVPVAGLAIWGTGRRSRLLDMHMLMLAYAAWVVLSVLWALDSSEAILRAGVAVQLCVMVLLVWEFGQAPDQVRQLLMALVAGAAMLVGSVLWIHFSGTGGSRLTAGSNTHPNDVAFTICLAMPVAWHLSMRARHLPRILLRLFIPLGIFAIVLTASRSAVLLVGVALLIIPWTLPDLTWKARGAIVVVVAASVALAPALLPDRQVERIATTLTSVESGQFSGRERLWAIAVDALEERPLIGWGGGGSRVFTRVETGRGFGVHNTFLSVATEEGLIGLALFSLWLFAACRHLLRASPNDKRLGIVLMATLLFGFLPRHWEYHKMAWLVIALVTAIAVVGTDDDDPAYRTSPR